MAFGIGLMRGSFISCMAFCVYLGSSDWRSTSFFVGSAAVTEQLSSLDADKMRVCFGSFGDSAFRLSFTGLLALGRHCLDMTCLDVGRKSCPCTKLCKIGSGLVWQLQLRHSHLQHSDFWTMSGKFQHRRCCNSCIMPVAPACAILFPAKHSPLSHDIM